MKQVFSEKDLQMIGLRIDQLIREHGLTNEEIAEGVHLFPTDISQVRGGQARWLTHDHLRDFNRILHLMEGRERKGTSLSDETVEQLFLGGLPPEYKY